MKQCPQCHAQVGDNAKFCAECGFNIKKHEDEQKNLFCPACGTPRKNGKFCAECGYRFAEAVAPTAPAESVFDNNWLGDLGNVTATAVAEEKARRQAEEKARRFANFTYDEQANGNVSITGLKNKSLLDLVIPTGVVAIADGALEGCDCLSVSLPKTLVRIGARAFAGCRFLKTVALPSSLQIIGDEAFADCISLDITIPKGLKTIGKNAIKNTVTGKEIEKQEAARREEEERARQEEKKRWLAEVEKELGKNAIDENNVIIKWTDRKKNDIVIPKGITKIGPHAFDESKLYYGSPHLYSIFIPEGVTEIGKLAFLNCRFLKNIVLPHTLQKIDLSAFSGCLGLTSITIPAGVTEIGTRAFAGCQNLKSITFAPHSQLLSIGERAFSECGWLNNVVIPRSVTEIHSYAFEKCECLSSISFEKGSRIGRIDGLVFSQCVRLPTFTVPASVSRFGMCVFEGCSKLATVTFEEPTGWMAYKWDDLQKARESVTTFTDPVKNAIRLRCEDASYLRTPKK